MSCGARVLVRLLERSVRDIWTAAHGTTNDVSSKISPQIGPADLQVL